MKVPLRGRGGKQDKLKESKSAFSLHSAVIYLNFILPVWGSGMSQWNPTPLLYLEIIARCRWPCCAPLKIDPIWGVISLGDVASTILYQRVSLSCKRTPLSYLLLPFVTCWMPLWCLDGSLSAFSSCSFRNSFIMQLKNKHNVVSWQCCLKRCH